MSKVAVCFSTKDRVELSKQSLIPLLDGAHAGQFDLFINDGSDTKEGEEFADHAGYPTAFVTHNVRGGADSAIVYALSLMLNHAKRYAFCCLVENDVLLSGDWFDRCIQLFDLGARDGLAVGAVSARSYEDRILIQRDDYAIMHNLGAGMIMLTREAAELVLRNFRTGWWHDNRSVFAQLSGLDIGRWGAFRGNNQQVGSDWHFETVLAKHGLAALAVTPALCTMIGQVPPLAEQGLTLVEKPVELLRNEEAFRKFAGCTEAIRSGIFELPMPQFSKLADGAHTFYPHQIEALNGTYEGDWRLHWCMGFGPFAYRAEHAGFQLCQATIPVFGPCSFLVGGGKNGGTVRVEDLVSGYKSEPELPPEGEQTTILQIVVPAGVSYREVKLTALTTGIVFYGLQTQEPQPYLPSVKFEHSRLPPV